jgi:CRP/FNR family cyclic AMP-dependent transcriptional regulator
MDLDLSERERLFEHYGRRHPAGKAIFKEGEPADLCYLLQEGRVRLTKHVRAMEHSIGVLRPGEIFGEDSLVPNASRSSSAVALTDVTALAFDRETFGMLLSGNPNVGFRLLEQLVSRLRDAEERLENKMLRDHPSRVINTLLRLATINRPSDGVYALDVSPLELSSRVGLDVDAVKQVIAQLRDGGYLRIQAERVVIMDLEALRRLYELLGVKEQVKA